MRRVDCNKLEILPVVCVSAAGAVRCSTLRIAHCILHIAHCFKYLHCFVFICGRQASGRWIDGAIRETAINWELISVFGNGISVRSRVCAGQIIPAFSAVERMRKLL